MSRMDRSQNILWLLIQILLRLQYIKLEKDKTKMRKYNTEKVKLLNYDHVCLDRFIIVCVAFFHNYWNGW